MGLKFIQIYILDKTQGKCFLSLFTCTSIVDKSMSTHMWLLTLYTEFAFNSVNLGFTSTSNYNLSNKKLKITKNLVFFKYLYPNDRGSFPISLNH